ncbi:PHP domain-containing protein [Dissulfurirhabdus thermomarina]|uniref:PHP domain-containing protein n=1 Tax=Dissulfurirhabdus thermomarina TaxID=1765737 RepID=A0A6N9TTJ8_DISTH|nr:PHP domain-containing protein [Dissulfurirhabdus thermomarina]NDY43423.1 PHP domain-containing protein [Dissulfurirhabdus thermomarina]NMX23955.1 PHP domain-containing protein [Dissulfurirhabdus thermomarina]
MMAPPDRICDLHTHTLASDGSDAPSALVRLAAAAGLAAVAVTDHDTVAGLDEAAAAGRETGCEVVPGVELSIKDPRGNFHLLGYLIDPASPELQKLLARVQAARSRRNERLLERLEALRLPLARGDVEHLAAGGQVGRPHFARAMVARGYVRSVGEAFARYLGKGGPAYVPKSVLSLAEGIAAIHAAGGLAVLAHPLSLGIEGLEALERRLGEWAALGLDGMECHYGDYAPGVRAALAALCRRHGLAATGGSDYHGRAKPDIRIGRGRGDLRVPYACLEALRRRREERA